MSAEARALKLEQFASQFVKEARELLLHAARDTRELARLQREARPLWQELMIEDEQATELHVLVIGFATKMVRKLLAKYEDGWEGWEDPKAKPEFEDRLIHHFMRALHGDPEQWIDVANFAAFLDHMEKTDAPS